MFAAEPAPSPADLHFRLFGVPVRIHPLFWLVTILLGIRDAKDGAFLILWVASVLLSILVHEFGHVLAYTYYGMRGRIVLYSFGGLAIADQQAYGQDWGRTWQPPGYREDADGWRQIAISFAGPLAGFIFAGVVILGILISGASHEFYFIEWPIKIGAGDPVAAFNGKLALFVDFLLYVNLFWGLVNLLPVYPLDGGHIARELFLMANYRTGIRRSLVISAVTAAAMVVVMLVWRNQGFLAALLFGSLAYSSYAMLKAYENTGYGGYRDRDLY